MEFDLSCKSFGSVQRALPLILVLLTPLGKQMDKKKKKFKYIWINNNPIMRRLV